MSATANNAVHRSWIIFALHYPLIALSLIKAFLVWHDVDYYFQSLSTRYALKNALFSSSSFLCPHKSQTNSQIKLNKSNLICWFFLWNNQTQSHNLNWLKLDNYYLFVCLWNNQTKSNQTQLKQSKVGPNRLSKPNQNKLNHTKPSQQ